MEVRQKQLNFGRDDQVREGIVDLRFLLFRFARMVSAVRNGAFRISIAYPLKNISLPLNKGITALRDQASTRLWIAAIFVGAITFSLRALNLGQSFEIFIDEYTYLEISQSVAKSFQVMLYGHPFYLHPPAYFFIEAAFLRLFPPGGDTIHTIYATRFINVIISSISAALLFLIAQRARGWLPGILVAVLFGLNPFVIKMNSLNMLETSALGFIIAGYWILVSGMRNSNDSLWSLSWVSRMIPKRFSRGSSKKRRLRRRKHNNDRQTVPAALALEPLEALPMWRLAWAGLFFGLALLVKESTSFLTLVPLLVCFVLQWVIRRRDAVIIGMVASLIYSIYPLVVFLSGDWAVYSQQKFRGILRFLGILHITGFNKAGGPSLSASIIHRLEMYGTTYLLIALGAIAAVLLIANRGRITRLIGILVVSSFAMMVYLIFLGTLEEQYFFYLVVPCILACGIGVSLIKDSFVYQRFGRQLLILFVCGALLFTGWDTYQWIDTHTRRDNGYEQMLAYLRKNVPGGAKVASTSETGQYVLEGYLTGPWGMWYTVEALKKYKPDYLLVTPQTVRWNYGSSADKLFSWIEAHGTLTYQVSGRQGNRIELYDLDWSGAQ